MSCHNSEWNVKQNSFTFCCWDFLVGFGLGFFVKKKAFSFILTIQTSLPLQVFLCDKCITQKQS